MNSSRRFSQEVRVGNLGIGGQNPIRVQSMTDTPTADVQATVRQVSELAEAGSELVRLTVNDEAAARAIPLIREKLNELGYENLPLVGDFHYNGHRLLKEFPECAKILDKYRINPGNVGFGEKKDRQFAEIIEQAMLYDKPVRIGVNWGSLDQSLLAQLMDQNSQAASPEPANVVTRHALIQSALQSAAYAQTLGMNANQIILACKVSDVQELIHVYRMLASQCDYALHLGLTEAGMGTRSIVATSVALGVLLQEGIGDTIRASLTPSPGGSRTEEVKVCQSILQTMGLRAFSPSVSACPGCGRTSNDYYQHLAQDIETYLAEQMSLWQAAYPGVVEMKVAVMGCVVNGPGESKHADIGISLPGSGEQPVAPVFIDGRKTHTLRGERITDEFKAILADYVQQRYAERVE